jgi:tetratricopeptide (TPR) repeat protein
MALEASLHQNPAQPDAWAELGVLYFKDEEFDKALYAKSQAIHYDPSAARYQNRAITFRDLGRRQEQLADLNQAVAVAPEMTKYRRERQWLLMMMGYLDQALADAEQNAQIDPQKSWYMSDRGRALAQMGRYPEALESMDKALAIDPHEHHYHRFKSAILRLGGRHHEAVLAANAAIALGPDDARNYRVRALAYAAMGDDLRAASDRAAASRIEDRE